jgi:hypothetical protein
MSAIPTGGSTGKPITAYERLEQIEAEEKTLRLAKKSPEEIAKETKRCADTILIFKEIMGQYDVPNPPSLEGNVQEVAQRIENYCCCAGWNVVKNLSFSGKSLSSFPKIIFWKSESLISLDLSNNAFEDESLDFLQRKSSLQVLNLSRNLFSQFHLDPFTFSTLRELDLSHNRLTTVSSGSSFAFYIDVLTSLEVLNLSHNKLSSLPSDFGNLGRQKNDYGFRVKNFSLKQLHLSHNRLTELPQFMENFQRLELLDLQQNYLSGDECRKIVSNLPNLHWDATGQLVRLEIIWGEQVPRDQQESSCIIS